MTETDILADLEAMPRAKSGVPCSVETMREKRPDLAPQWDRLLAAVEGQRWPHRRSDADVSAWFREKAGYDLDEQAIARHRRNECKRCRTS